MALTATRMGIRAIVDYGFEKVIQHSADLSIGKWGAYWSVIDTIASAEIGRPSQIGNPVKQRWLAVEQADARIRSGDYQ